MIQQKGTQDASTHRAIRLSVPLMSLALLLITIFLFEWLIMLILERLAFPGFLETLIDAVSITIIMVPIAYLLVFRPLLTSLESTHEAIVEKQISADHYRRLIELSPSGTIVLENDNIEFANTAAVSLMGASSTTDLTGGSVLDMFTPESSASMKKCIAAAKKGYTVTPGMHLEMACCENNTMHVEATIIPMITADATKLLLLLTDITERHLAEQALLSVRDSFESIILRSISGYLVVDSEGVIRFINHVAAQMLQTGPADLIDTVFKFPIKLGSTTEIEIDSEAVKNGLAEMTFSSTRWKNESATLVSLRDITESVKLRDELRALSISDELTGVKNRRGFMELAQQQLKLAKRSGSSLGILFIDLDKMKWINDNLGHEYGDMALKELSGILKDAFRESDIIGRMGGDEFAVMIIGATANGEQALHQSIRKQAEMINAQPDRKFMLEYSVGYVRYDPKEHRSLNELLTLADTLMYEEKLGKHVARA